MIAVAAAAAIVGDNLGYWLIGRRGGRALIRRYPWIERRTQHVLPRAETLIARYGGRAVFFGRFVGVLRETIARVAALARMSWPRFLFWNRFGGIVWATTVGLLAYFGGKAISDIAWALVGVWSSRRLEVAAVLDQPRRRHQSES